MTSAAKGRRSTKAARSTSSPAKNPRGGAARSRGGTTKGGTARRRKVAGELGGPYEQLWRDYQQTHHPDLRNTLCEMYMPVVDFIAERMLLTLPKSIDVDDLKSAGVFGLMDAIEGFDIERGIKFKTYCSTRVRGAILDALRAQDWVPRLVRLKAHQIARAQQTLEARHGRLPTHHEMADELGVRLDEYLALNEEAQAHTVSSLSEAWDDGSGDQAVEKIEFLRDAEAPDPADVMNQKDVLHAITRSLNRKEKLIVLMYYVEGLTMKQIGIVLALTESRVCQIHSNVMKKLRVHLEECRELLMI